jgi:hypothetical protein
MTQQIYWGAFTLEQWGNFTVDNEYYYFEVDRYPTSYANISGISTLFSQLGIKFGIIDNISGVLDWNTTDLGIKKRETIDFYIKGMNTISASFPMYINGAYNKISNSIPFYIANSGISNGIYLYTKGFGRNNGYFPYSSSFPMWIGSSGTYLESGIPLYIGAALGTISGTLNLNVGGSISISSGIFMFVSGVGQNQTSLDLFTHGY